MFGKTLVLITALIVLSSCAKPKYVNETPANQDPNAQEAQADCSTQFQISETCLNWYWEQKPTSQQPGSLVFKTYRLNTLDQTPVELDMEQTPSLILWMSSMGHGSTPTQTSRVDVGTYRASNVFFIMPGDWQLKFQIKNGTEILDEAQVNIIF